MRKRVTSDGNPIDPIEQQVGADLSEPALPILHNVAHRRPESGLLSFLLGQACERPCGDDGITKSHVGQ